MGAVVSRVCGDLRYSNRKLIIRGDRGKWKDSDGGRDYVEVD